MSKETHLEAAIRKYEGDVDFVLDGVLMRLNEAIVAAMQAKGMNRAELASRMGTSKAYITRLLRGDANPTVRSLVRLGLILGVVPTVTFGTEPDRAASAKRVAVQRVRHTWEGTSYPAFTQVMQPGETAERVPARCEAVRFAPATTGSVEGRPLDQNYA